MGGRDSRVAQRTDVFKGLQICTWPVVYNPENFPCQTDLESCGIFTIFVAEHVERGLKPDFKQSDIPILRSRAVMILKRGHLSDLEGNSAV